MCLSLFRCLHEIRLIEQACVGGVVLLLVTETFSDRIFTPDSCWMNVDEGNRNRFFSMRDAKLGVQVLSQPTNNLHIEA